MPRSLAIVRASVAASIVALALVGCTQAPSGAPTSTCGGATQKVLLADDSATTVTQFTADDVPKIFAVPATPAPTCYYKTTTTPAPVNGISYTVTHRTLLYTGLSDAQVSALVASVRATVGVAPWSGQYDDGVPAAPASPTPGATPAPATAPVAVSYAGMWEYNLGGAITDSKGEMGYYVASPLTDGTATHAGLPAGSNVVRIETELREPGK